MRKHIVCIVMLLLSGVVFGHVQCGKFFVAAANKKIKIWDTITWKPVKTFQEQTIIGSVTISHVNGNIIACGLGDKTVSIYDMSKPKDKERIVVLKNNGKVGQVLFSPLEKNVLAVVSGNNIVVWDWEKKKILNTLKDAGSFFSFHYGNKDVLVAGKRVWSWRAGIEKKTLKLGEYDRLNSVAFSPVQKNTIALGVFDTSDDMTDQVQIFNTANDDVVKQVSFGASDWSQVAFSFFQAQIVGIAKDESVEIWDWKKGSLLKDIKSPYCDLVFSPHQNKVLALSHGKQVDIYKADKLWTDAKKIKTLQVEGEISAIAF